MATGSGRRKRQQEAAIVAWEVLVVGACPLDDHLKLFAAQEAFVHQFAALEGDKWWEARFQLLLLSVHLIK